MKISAHSPCIFWLWPIAISLLAGCSDPKPVAYRVPKEAAPEASAPAVTPGAERMLSPGDAMANTAVATAAGPALQWTAPSHWRAKPLGAMRKGSYSVPGENGAEADLSITAFPGDVGGEVANLNRWRGQLQLEPLAQSEAAAAVVRVEHNGLAFGVVDFANSAAPVPQGILGAMVPFQGATWFFKLNGPAAVVAQDKAAFLEFLKTVQIASAPAGAPPPENVSAAAPAPVQDRAMADIPVATAAGLALQWAAPAHWRAKPAGGMRKGSYTVPGENGAEADLSITAFPGDVGGEVANVNRWRGQLQLAPLAESEGTAAVSRIEHHGLAIGIVDFANDAGPAPQRILGAMVPFQGATWFFKLNGPDAVVAKEKPAFLEFLQTVQPATPAP